MDLKKLLDELEDAIPEIQKQLGTDDGSDAEEGSPEEEASESPDEEAAEGDDAGGGYGDDSGAPPFGGADDQGQDDGAPMDLSTPPPFPPKKKKGGLPPFMAKK